MDFFGRGGTPKMKEYPVGVLSSSLGPGTLKRKECLVGNFPEHFPLHGTGVRRSNLYGLIKDSFREKPCR